MSLVCSAYPAGVKAEGRRGGNCLAACPQPPQVRPPRSPGGARDSPPGEVFLGTLRPTQIGVSGSLATFPFPGPGKAARLPGLPAPLPKTFPSLEPAPRDSPASHAACVALCVCMRGCVGASSVRVCKLWVAVSVPAFCLKASRNVVSGVHRTRWQSRGGEYEPLVV